jgi:hypothetical protein
MVVMSIFFTGIIASKARLASTPPDAGASVSARVCTAVVRKLVNCQVSALRLAQQSFVRTDSNFPFERDQHDAAVFPEGFLSPVVTEP